MTAIHDVIIQDMPTQYVVDSLEDIVAPDGVLTLREAIEAANTNQAVNEAAAGSGTKSDVITFATSLSNGTIVLAGTQLEIRDDLKITGMGQDALTINANESSQAFSANSGIIVRMKGISITGGSASQGGGIYNNGKHGLRSLLLSSEHRYY